MARSLGEAVLLIRASTKQSVTSLQNFGRNLHHIGASAVNVGTRMRNFGVAASAGLAAMFAPAVSFEKQMFRVKAITNATNKEFEMLSNEAKRLGETTVFSASEVAEAQQFLAMAGLSTDQIMKSLAGTLSLAQAGNLGLAQSADIATNIMSGFGKKAGDLNGIIDDLATVATNSNTNLVELGEGLKFAAPIASKSASSMDEVNAAMGVLADNGLKATVGGTAIRAILLSLAKPTKEAQVALKKMGVSMDEVNPKTKGLTQILKRLSAAGIDLQKATAIFGKRGATPLAALTSADSIRKLDELQKKLRMNAGAAKVMGDTMTDNVWGALKQIKSAIEGLSIAIFEAMGSSIKDMALEVANMIRGWTKWVKANEQTVKALVKLAGIIAGFAVTLGTILSIVGTAIIAVGGFINVLTALGAVLSAGMSTLILLASTFGVVVAAVVYTAKEIHKNWDSIKKTLADSSFLQIMKATWNGLKQVVVNAIKSIQKAIANAKQKFDDFMQQDRVQALVKKWENFKAKVFPVLKAFGIWIKESAIALFKWAEEAVPAAGTAIMTWLLPIIEELVALFEKVKAGLIQVPWERVAQVIRETVFPVFDAFIGLLTFFKNVFTDIIMNLISLWEGFAEGFGATMAIMGPVFEQMMEAIQTLAQIFIDAFGESEEGMFQFREAFKVVGQVIGSTVAFIVTIIAGFVKAVADGISAIILGWQMLVEEFATGGQNIIWGLQQVWEFLKSFAYFITVGWIQMILQAFADFVAKIIISLDEWRLAFIEWYSDILASAITWIDQMITGFIQFFVDMYTAVKDGLGKVLRFFKEIFKFIWEEAKAVGKRLYEAGKNMVGQFLQGIKDHWKDMKLGAKHLWNDFKGMFKWTKKSSPSMKDIWENTMMNMKKTVMKGSAALIKEVHGVHLTPPTVGAMGTPSNAGVLTDQRSLNMNLNTQVDMEEVKRQMSNHFNNNIPRSGSV